MDVKKSFRADLKNKRTLLLEIGVVAALAMVVAVFSYIPGEPGDGQVERPAAKADTVAVVQPDEPEQAPVAALKPLPQRVRSVVGRQPVNITEADSLVEIVELLPIQEEELPEDDYHVDPPPESLPKFEDGGLKQFLAWVCQNVKFPRIALESGIQGRVVLSFVIGKDGSLTGIQVLQTPDRSLSEEAIRVLNKSPKWTPGTVGGRAVSVKFILPIDFHVQN